MDYLFFSIGLIVALVAGFILARKLAPKAGADTGADEQKTILETQNNELKTPDVVIHLPDNKHVIIDSKVSLTHYEGFCSAETAEEKSQYLAQFLRSVKKHVTDLQDRGYEHIDKLESPDFVLMFMPIEGAYALAVQSDTELHRYAWDKKIVIVCPSTLFATLKTIASIWRLELQNKHAVEIARQGGELYDKVVGFIEDMGGWGAPLGGGKKPLGGGLNKLSTGRGNIIGKTEKLKTLGAKAKKSMPTEFLNDENGAVADLPSPTPNTKL